MTIKRVWLSFPVFTPTNLKLLINKMLYSKHTNKHFSRVLKTITSSSAISFSNTLTETVPKQSRYFDFIIFHTSNSLIFFFSASICARRFSLLPLLSLSSCSFLWEKDRHCKQTTDTAFAYFMNDFTLKCTM